MRVYRYAHSAQPNDSLALNSHCFVSCFSTLMTIKQYNVVTRVFCIFCRFCGCCCCMCCSLSMCIESFGICDTINFYDTHTKHRANISIKSLHHMYIWFFFSPLSFYVVFNICNFITIMIIWCVCMLPDDLCCFCCCCSKDEKKLFLIPRNRRKFAFFCIAFYIFHIIIFFYLFAIYRCFFSFCCCSLSNWCLKKYRSIAAVKSWNFSETNAKYREANNKIEKKNRLGKTYEKNWIKTGGGINNKIQLKIAQDWRLRATNQPFCRYRQNFLRILFHTFFPRALHQWNRIGKTGTNHYVMNVLSLMYIYTSLKRLLLLYFAFLHFLHFI